MTGARALIGTLVGAGVDVCFTNPGTSELFFVAAFDDVPEMRGVLTLFEGVATGAADGYARMAGRPAATLSHLGPGMGNGLANLHNARRARTPLVNVVGDHARSHKRLDAPLESDIDSVAGTFSCWVRRSLSPADVGADAADAVAAARSAPGGVATLIVPADVSWEGGASVADPKPPRPASRVPASVVEDVAAALGSGEPAMLLVGGDVVAREEGQLLAAQVAAGTGARLLCDLLAARVPRGAGLPRLPRFPYPPPAAIATLAGIRHLVLAGAPSPVHFFAYPGVPGAPVPADCTVHVLAAPGEDGVAAMRDLSAACAVDAEPALLGATRPEPPTGALTPRSLAAVVGALLPEGAIVVDESITASADLVELTAGAPRHDWLSQPVGGALGGGLPAAAGAAVACPDRPVVVVEADGSAMYTIQALWTHAREQLDVTTIVCNNRSYAILQGELSRLGRGSAGERAERLLDIGGPDLDFVSLAAGMGVPGSRASTAEELAAELRRALAEPGPHLVEALLAPRG